MGAFRFLSLLFVGIWLCCSPAFAGKRVALVIGNSAYQHVNRLSNPANDSESMSATLKAAGFDVVDLQQNLKVAALRKALRDFSDKATDADKVAVFNTLYLNTGTYTVAGTTLAGKAMVAKSKFAIGGAGNQYEFAVSGNTLTLTQKPSGAVLKLTRLE